jgi:hypothetical protein
VIVSGQQARIEAHVDQIRAMPDGQVVARIGIPGGCRIDASGPIANENHREVKDGYLVLYWEQAPRGVDVSFTVTGTAPGTYASGPSVVYPYYRSGCEAFAPGLTVKVVPAYDAATAQAAAALGK